MIDICGFTALETDQMEIVKAVEKDNNLSDHG
jgi:hypothetical protein